MNSQKGFTLIELLVVIAIIAVLAVIGFAVFNGLTTRGNDAKRQADLKSIADSLEVDRGAVAYIPIDASSFASGAIPIEPSTSRVPKYCFNSGGAAITIPTAASWGGGTPTACPSGWTNLNAVATITPAGCSGGAGSPTGCTATFFKVCTMNEAGSANTTGAGAAVICVGSKQ